MTSTTTILSLPLMSPSQAQKTVTHNEALVQLDAMVQLSVMDRTRTAPPASPALGQTHLVAALATGAWAGKDRKLAVWNGTAWEFHAPLTGWRAYVKAEGTLAAFSGTGWITESDVAHSFPQLGINGASDATNKLMVRGAASLFQGDTGGHQVKINKIGSTATASLALQTGFATRAEIGLVGNNDLTLKVSPDGSSFVEGLVLDGTSGHVTVKQGLNLLPAAGDPVSPLNGDLWYNSTTGKFRGRQGGGNIDMAIGGSSTFSASTFTVQDTVDTTKKMQFGLSGLTTGTTRTISVPNMSGTLAIFANFGARAAALSWLAGENQPDGTVITVAGLAFRKKPGATAIADMPNWLPAVEVYVDHFGENTAPGTTDMSAAIQAALTYVGGLGGGEVRLGQGTYVAKGLTVPHETYLVGQGIDATTLKLKNAANTWLLASSNYAANATFANLYGGTRDITLDGNKANNLTGSLVWFCAYRAKFIRTRFTNSGGAGLVLTAIMANGTTFLANGMAENQVAWCHFDTNATHGLWAQDGAANRTADAEITCNHFNANGGAGIHAERCNGWKITHNQIYLSGTHCIYVNELARTVITGNHLDLLANAATAASRNACVYVDVISTQGAWVVSGNIFLINDTADSAGLALTGLAIMSASVDPAMIGANTFVDLSVAQGGTELFLNAAASASLTKAKWLVEAQGPGKVVQSLAVVDSGFALQDNVDATKKGQFELSGLTTGTTRTFTMPDASTTLVGVGVQQTFTTKQTFASSNNDFGTSALTGTINLASGAVSSGNTKTVNIGTGGVSGSTTAIAVGSATAGAGGSLTINSPVVGFGAAVTAFNIPDSVFTLQDNADATKKAQFELSGITTATTRAYTLPNATGTLALNSAFTSAAAGLAPASGGGTANYLRADGTWAAPPAGGGVTDGDKGDVVVSGVGTVWSLDYTAVNAVVAPVWANVTGKPTTVTALGLTDAVALAGAQTITGDKTFAGAIVFSGSSTVLDSGLIMQDNLDTTKKAQFELSGITTATTRTFSLPDTNGTVLVSGQPNPFIATGTGTVSVSIATGATISGGSKTVGIGTGGLSGSTTAVVVGSAVAGAGGSLVINSPSVSFGSTVTSVAVPDAAFTLQDNLDATKQAKFELAGLTTATTRNYSLPDATGTLALNTAFSGAAAGLAPASGGGTANFLRADGTWAAPAGGGAPGGTSGQIQFNNAGAFGGYTMSGDATITTGGVLTLGAGAVTLAKQANVAANSVIGNATGAAAVPAAVTLASSATVSSLVFRDTNANTQINNSRQGYSTTATAAGTTTLTAASTYLQFFTGTLAQTLVLPDVTSLVLGHQFYIRNNSTGLVTVGSSGGNLLRILGPGTRCIVSCVLTTGTSAASWSAMYVGISIADGKVLTASNSLTLAGMDGTVMTFPATSASVARIDAAQTFAGVQSFGAQQVWTGQTTDPASPTDGTVWFDGQSRSIDVTLGTRKKDVFADLVNSGAMVWKAINAGTSFTTLSTPTPIVIGTLTAATVAVTNKHTMYPRVESLVTVAATTAIASLRSGGVVTVGGGSSDLGGFRYSLIWGPATGVATATNRALAGLQSNASTPTDVEPSTTLNGVWMGWDAADANCQMMFNDGTATATKVDLGASFPVPTVDRTSVYKLELYSPKGTTQSVQWRVTDMVSGAAAQGTQNTDLPATSQLIGPRVWMSVGGTSSVIGVAMMSMYLDPLL